MEEFRHSKLILGEDRKVFQLNSISELVEKILGDEYEKLSASEKLKIRYNVAYPRAILHGMQVAISDKGILTSGCNLQEQEVDINNSILIDDETMLLLSLSKINDIQILEEKNANIFGKSIDKSNFEGNYINIGRFAQKIIEENLKAKDKDNGER